MPRPIDLTKNNTPIPQNYNGDAGKGNCACGGKGCNNHDSKTPLHSNAHITLPEKTDGHDM